MLTLCGWSKHAHSKSKMADGRRFEKYRKIAISRTVGPSSRNLARSYIDPLKSTGPNKMLFAGRTRVRPTNHVLVTSAHWRLLANMIKPSVCGGQEWAVPKTAKPIEMPFGGHTPVGLLVDPWFRHHLKSDRARRHCDSRGRSEL